MKCAFKGVDVLYGFFFFNNKKSHGLRALKFTVSKGHVNFELSEINNSDALSQMHRLYIV